jgi:hypothetical protein
MVRQKGTLINFLGDGAISKKSYEWVLQTGKIAAGKERSQIIERTQLKAWGILIESDGGAI